MSQEDVVRRLRLLARANLMAEKLRRGETSTCDAIIIRKGERYVPRTPKAEWIENGEIRTGPRIDDEKFGPHDYPGCRSATDFYTSECAYGCGCLMGNSSSRGPVDPFGPCPRNPLGKIASKEPKKKPIEDAWDII